METKRLAILIDFENLVIGLENIDPDSEKSFSAKALINYLESNYGSAMIRKAFADWSNPKLRKYTYDLMRNGFEMQHIIRGNFGSKGYAESHIIIQAIDCMNSNPDVDTLVLATGDADFLPIISYLKSKGKTVIGAGTEGTVSGALLSNCDAFIYYGNNGLYQASSTAPDKGRIIRSLRNYLRPDGIELNELEEKLLEEMPDFSPYDFGCSDFRAFLDTIPNCVHLEENDEQCLVFSNNYQQIRSPRPCNHYTRPLARVDANLEEMQSMPLDEYMKQTRWFITDGEARENILLNIYNILAENDSLLPSDTLRSLATQNYNVDDKPWQGTIFSLVCGNCLWEKPDTNQIPQYMRKVSIHRNIHSIDEFLEGYYVSLFHKAYIERQDLSPESMAELMHPEAIEQHMPLFERVYDIFSRA